MYIFKSEPDINFVFMSQIFIQSKLDDCKQVDVM